MSFQVSTMQLLTEAHNHEEGWFQKQMCALVLKAGSDQGSLGSRENTRGQGGSHATCAEAWPSSSDEGGPSNGARDALVVQKGKSGTAGTRSTSLRGAGTSSTARKRSGTRVELAVRGLEDKGLGAGPDRRFKSPPGTGASKDGAVSEVGTGGGDPGRMVPSSLVGSGDGGVIDLVKASLAPGTWGAYVAAWREFREGERMAGGKISEVDILLGHMMSLRDKGLAGGSIGRKMVGISFFLRLNGRVDVSKCFVVRKVLAGLVKGITSRDGRRPVTPAILEGLLRATDVVCSSSFEAVLFKATFILAFFAALRAGELVCVSKKGGGGLQRADVSLGEGLVRLLVRRSKTDQKGKGAWILLKGLPGSVVCTVKALEDYLAVRPEQGGPLLVHKNGGALSRFQYLRVFRMCLKHQGLEGGQYGTHSFRIGAATEAARVGLAVAKIRKDWALEVRQLPDIHQAGFGRGECCARVDTLLLFFFLPTISLPPQIPW
ncbi:uncharacterized protein LOC142488268 [Ascaphus truei]|uniref:uncharacterized protein LOC142488268 n=1 Tax=Ascaphus truei TaxID=8439 RepID=UPI003F595EDD